MTEYDDDAKGIGTKTNDNSQERAKSIIAVAFEACRNYSPLQIEKNIKAQHAQNGNYLAARQKINMEPSFNRQRPKPEPDQETEGSRCQCGEQPGALEYLESSLFLTPGN